MEQNPNGQSTVQHHKPMSSLPCDILHKIIITHLKFPRSSIFTISATTFDVDICEPVTYKCCEFWKILDNLFTILTTPSVNTFRIHLPHALYEARCVRPILNSWARRLLARNFKHISIKSYTRNYSSTDYYIRFPPSVYQIHSLVSLELHSFIMDDKFYQLISHPIILPNLKKLVLRFVYYWFFEWLFSCCPSIEDLSFVSRTTPNNRRMSIWSKVLKRLSITISYWSSSVDFFDIIIDAPVLEYLHYDCNSFLPMRMFDLIPNVKSVQIFGYSMIELHSSRPTKKIILPSLTHLTLPLSSEIFEAIFVQQMLHCPNLETLRLKNFEFYLYEFNWDTEAIFGLVEHVKRLELHMDGVTFDQKTLNLVTWLLRSAPVLEKLILSAERGPYHCDNILPKAQFRKTLFECAKDSSGCQIILFGKWRKLVECSRSFGKTKSKKSYVTKSRRLLAPI